MKTFEIQYTVNGEVKIIRVAGCDYDISSRYLKVFSEDSKDCIFVLSVSYLVSILTFE